MRKFLYLGVFSAGCASLAVELSASRLLGNYFGSSNLVWAAVISLILIYLSVGYSIGGRWADRSPNYRTFFSILCWASLLIGLVPLVSRPILRLASQAFDDLQSGVLIGSFTAVLVLFSAPVILLGTASPFAVRLALEDKESSGAVAGKIYTVSTIGAFIGTFLPVLLLIPTLGTYRTFILISVLLMALAFLGLGMTVSAQSLLRFIWMPLLLIAASIWGLRGYDKSAQNIIFEGESAYNYIQVQEIDRYRLLRLNEGQGVHSVYHPDQIITGGPWDQVLSAPFFYPSESKPEQVKKMAILGLAAGTSANQATLAFPEVQIDGYEIDPEIVDIGYQFFELGRSNPNIFIQDARWGISNSKEIYDIISVDAYRPPYIPWHLTTSEFFHDVYEHLVDNGTMVINVARILDDRRLVNALYQTIASVFPSVYIVDLPNTLNSVIFATRMKSDQQNLLENYIRLTEMEKIPDVLLTALGTAIMNIQSPPSDGLVLTDDHAPVEWIVNAMLFDLFLNEDIEVLQ